jgi:hypothetical protein
MKRLLEAFGVVRKEYKPSVFYWPIDEPPDIRAGSITGVLSVVARDDMDVDDLKAFVRRHRHLFPEETDLRVHGQSAQAATIAINAIESMAPFRRIDIRTWTLDSRWKQTGGNLTNIKTDVPIFWGVQVYDATPIFDPCKVRELSIVGPVQLRPSSDEIRLQRLTIGDLDEVTGIHHVRDHLLSLKLNRELSIAVHSFKEFSSLKVLDLRRSASPRSDRLPEIILPPSLDTLKLTGFTWGVLIRGKVDYAKMISDFYGTPGEYRFNTPPDFIWVTPTSARYIGVFIRGNIDDYKVVAGEVRNRPSGDRDQIQTTSAPFFAVKVH